MTSNHEREPYKLSGLARVHGAVARQTPLDWARSVHTFWRGGEYRPRKEPGDADKVIPKIRATVKLELVPEALKAIVRGENELRLRGLIRATRMLTENKDAKDKKHGAELSSFLRSAWGVNKAHEAVAEGEAELHDKLKKDWGDAQLPPIGATVNQWAADELLIQAAVRRLG
jgi:hypothetical protein